MNKIKTRPVIALADFCKAAGPLMPTEPVHVAYLAHGYAHSTKLRGKVLAGMYVAIVCPACGECCESLHPHPEDRGVICAECLARYEPWAEDDGPNRIVSVRRKRR